MRISRYIFIFAFFLLGFALDSHAQFKEDAFSQTYNEPGDSTAVRDSADKLFSFKEFFGGLAHKNEMKIGTMFAGSVIFPGASQIYNKDYWKLPVIYGGIGALAGSGGYYLHKYRKSKKSYDTYLNAKSAYEATTGQPFMHAPPAVDYGAKKTGTWLMLGAGLVYWGSLMDGVACYHSDRNPNPGRATLYSALLPGLGQIYNGELFKVPIYWGCLLGSVHFLTTNNINYKRFKRIHNEASSTDQAINSQVPISAETAKWYRDVYRRYRDYSIVATALFYLLQVIDANVFAYMHDFEVTDDISMDIEPAVLAPDNAYAINTPSQQINPYNAIGLRIGLKF